MLNEIDLARADLNLLVLFETVLREGHVGRSANRLNLTPSAVSHGLGRLRRLLNDCADYGLGAMLWLLMLGASGWALFSVWRAYREASTY